ncbi:MAG: methyl-accepting chemotaxis protein, partial [Clostridiaceae bacterium]|nr:methyl-accepting chemotaxis protein [Clostridiaceae bacterium]
IASLVKTDTGKITGGFKHVGDMANFIYEKVTRLEAETEVLRKGSSEFRESLKDVTQAIEDIAGGSSSIIADTEKIALHVAGLEKTLSDNREHIRCVAENMDRIIENKNQGLKLMSELRNITETTSGAIAQINKVVNETSESTNKIVEAGEFIKHIATQTNLLAFNAAIEAAAAGQSNTGFAVIAEEIRILSNETNRYVKEIRSYTEALAGSVVNALKVLEKVNSAIENEIKGVKDMDDLLDRINESTTSTQNYIVKLNESGDTILEQAKEIKYSISNLYAVNEENSANMCQASCNMHNQDPYIESIINLINSLCGMAYNIRDKSMEIKMLIDIGLLIDYLETEGYSNDNLIEICRKLNVTTAYVADETGYVHYCNEEIGRGVNLFEFDKSLMQLLNGADYVAIPIKQRAEDGKTYKFLSVYRNNKIYELGIDLSTSYH